MNKTLDQILFELNSIDDNIGIYPAAAQRTDYQQGWNACVMNYGRKISEIINRGEEQWTEPEKLFASSDDYFKYDLERGWYINVSDTWYYACADAEHIDKSEYKEVAKWYRRFGEAGILYWVYLKRQHLPKIKQFKEIVELIKNFVEKNIGFFDV